MRNWRVDLGDGYWYDNEPDYFQLSDETITKLEDFYNARYVGDWNTMPANGEKAYYNRLIMWTDKPHPDGSNWIALYRNDTGWYISDGITASQLPIWCVVSNDKQVLFSKSRHDFRTSHDGSVSIDGGREYTRVLGNVHCDHVWMVPQNGELKIIPETMAKLLSKDK